MFCKCLSNSRSFLSYSKTKALYLKSGEPDSVDVESLITSWYRGEIELVVGEGKEGELELLLIK